MLFDLGFAVFFIQSVEMVWAIYFNYDALAL